VMAAMIPLRSRSMRCSFFLVFKTSVAPDLGIERLEYRKPLKWQCQSKIA
jgi:hypothetical protein